MCRLDDRLDDTCDMGAGDQACTTNVDNIATFETPADAATHNTERRRRDVFGMDRVVIIVS